MGQQVLQIGDGARDLFVFILDLLALERRQTAQLHVEDRLGLQVGQLETLHQPFFGHVGIRRLADGLDHLVQVGQGDQQAFQDVRPRPGLGQLEFRAAGDDHPAVLDVELQRPFQREQPRLAVDQRQQLHAERRLQRRVLEELVEHLLAAGRPLGSSTTMLMPRRSDSSRRSEMSSSRPSRASSAMRSISAGLVDLVRDFGDDDAVPPARVLLDLRLRPDHQPALAGAVGLLDPVHADDHPARREVRPRHDAPSTRRRSRRRTGRSRRSGSCMRVRQLAQVVRRDVGRHADGDARRAVEQQVGQARRAGPAAP